MILYVLQYNVKKGLSQPFPCESPQNSQKALKIGVTANPYFTSFITSLFLIR